MWLLRLSLKQKYGHPLLYTSLYLHTSRSNPWVPKPAPRPPTRSHVKTSSSDVDSSLFGPKSGVGRLRSEDSAGSKVNPRKVLEDSAGSKTNLRNLLELSAGSKPNLRNLLEPSAGSKTNLRNLLELSVGSKTNLRNLLLEFQKKISKKYNFHL